MCSSDLLGIAVLTPLLLPLVLPAGTAVSTAGVVGSVTLVVFVPLVLARIVRWLVPAAAGWPPRLRNPIFLLWAFVIFLVAAHASHFLRSLPALPLGPLAGILGTSAAVCAANFALGSAIGVPRFRREASQALGQKNTAFTIYLALAYASPLAALGPTFYVVWHNLWNSWQLRRRGIPPAGPGESR